jgi:CMP-N-acetylneuraminic acid synthetase/spore coat polysaccharide biosynthesis predicted glycosyltransferase SpsG
MKILAVIPARGNSKGIPRKNIRLINNKPLIYYSINTAMQCPYITDIVVSTDDDEIASIALSYGTKILMRDKHLADDLTTLDPVVSDAVERMERGGGYDIIITLQPTSPTLKCATLIKAIEEFMEKGLDTLISAVNSPHLAWSRENNKTFPLYNERLNRQKLPPYYLETGAFLITRRKFVKQNSRIGELVQVYEISDEESIDIDNKNDWILCENILAKKQIVLRVDGYKQIGMGHIYHCITLAYNLTGHDIMFVTQKDCMEGIEKLYENNMPVTTIKDNNDFFDYLKKNNPDIVINDCLDSTIEYIKMLKSLVKRVVTIEDIGEGAMFADIVINALYESKITDKNNVYTGAKYVSLRNEFIYSSPKPFQEEVKQILVIFGGTDPANLTKIAYSSASNLHDRYPNIKFNFITGIGYECKVNGVVSNEKINLYVFEDCKYVSKIMKEADLAITSQGRTIYELACLGIPSIVMAQNAREETHVFAKMKNGFLNLGNGSHIETEELENTIEWLIRTPKIREEMRMNMLSHKLKDGIKREVNLILGE